jgi:hypothetical protein
MTDTAYSRSTAQPSHSPADDYPRFAGTAHGRTTGLGASRSTADDRYRTGRTYSRSVAELFVDGMNQFTRLVRSEVHLARAEMSEKVGEITAGIGMMVFGAVLLIPALVVLLQAAVVALINADFGAGWASLIVGGITLLIGLILVMVGMNRLKVSNLVPHKTMDQLQQDASVAKQTVSSDHDTTQRAA